MKRNSPRSVVGLVGLAGWLSSAAGLSWLALSVAGRSPELSFTSALVPGQFLLICGGAILAVGASIIAWRRRHDHPGQAVRIHDLLHLTSFVTLGGVVTGVGVMVLLMLVGTLDPSNSPGSLAGFGIFLVVAAALGYPVGLIAGLAGAVVGVVFSRTSTLAQSAAISIASAIATGFAVWVFLLPVLLTAPAPFPIIVSSLFAGFATWFVWHAVIRRPMSRTGPPANTRVQEPSRAGRLTQKGTGRR